MRRKREVIQAAIERKKERLEELRERFEAAEEARESAAWAKKLEDGIMLVARTLSTFKVGDSGDKAIFLLALVSERVSPIVTQLNMVARCESMSRDIEALYKQLDALDGAEDGS